MAILVDNDTRLLVQGITGREGGFHTGRMLQGNTAVVAGVTPARAGRTSRGARLRHRRRGGARDRANTSVIFVPASFSADAIFESLDAGMRTVCCITEGVPVHDMLKVSDYMRMLDATLIGPNCPGVISPGKSNVSIMPQDIFLPATSASSAAAGR
ncbi:hypothetical protein [Rubrobacter marinus]|uniref:hypothetical protein n=1 Tax=Rubrobacter marinus TaxID=2653852 RepID=UPI001D18CA62|nr:hypothetical protein [Rubrobacter marinus]